MGALQSLAGGPRQNHFILNPWRRHSPRRNRYLMAALRPLIQLGLLAGFTNLDYAYVHGPLARLHLAERCSVMNTIFNTYAGDIRIGEDTMFSHGCYVLTGTHRFYGGMRAGLNPDAPFREGPREGRDITIGRGCFIAANVTIIGPVTIGDNVIIGAGAVVTRDVPDASFAAGVPARVLRAVP